MSQTPVSSSGLVRVTVASGTRRVDLVLPGAVPVAELIPELARSVGLLDAATAYGGYHLRTSEGRRLESDTGLTLQGVEDGSVISVAAGIDEDAAPVYDDVVEAMTDVVEHDLKPWEPASGRRTALAAAVVLLALGAVALWVQATDIAAVAAAIVAGALTAGALVLSRAQDEPEAAVTVAWVGVGYAVLAGLMLAPAESWMGRYSFASAGAGALIVGLVCLLGLSQGRTLLVPAVVVGAVVLAAGLLIENTSADLGVVMVVVTTAVVVVGSVFPWLALSITTTSVDQLYSVEDIEAEPREINPQKVAADAMVAHELLVAISATVGLLLVLSAPFAVARGLWGTLLATVSCLIVMLRTRQYRTGNEVLVGLVSGVLGLAVVAVTVLIEHPSWHPTLAVVLAVAGGLLMAATLLPGSPSVRRGRFGDVLETICLLATLPLLILTLQLYWGG